ncbi:MAG: single-stranded-DNA-specific exonuclease RecJ, partial [Deltaproteobacteria bacterium]|nr:single-stranded-DNA-specific exonuclease RecJ [Deltaproteobacteria bacterium]
KPSLAQIRSPFSMKGIKRAVERIFAAIRNREKILIFGDFDTDGITATALLLEFLRSLEADVDYYIPNRLTEGYGLSRRYVEEQAIPNGLDLIITVDCGISSHEAVSTAKDAGIDVIITDHHETSSHTPEAIAVLDPKQPDCPSGFSWLAGVGVAFNLAMALRKRLRDEGYWEDRPEPNLKAACDLVALGTVADMVPLVDENRIYVRAGIEVLRSQMRPGIKALLDVSNSVHRHIETQDLSYKIAPRLNAAGRLRDASTALRLLTTSEKEEAKVIALELNDENTRRQKIERDILSGIDQSLKAHPSLLQQRALVLDHQDWHQGVIGIVASRLVDRYHRPVVLIAVADGIGKGSARSPSGFDVHDGLKRCAKHLERFGGHKRAAGLSLKSENISAFRRDFESIVEKTTEPEDLIPKLVIDGEIKSSDVSGTLADELEAFAPFGNGNPEPLFMLSDMKVMSSRLVGTSHLRLRLTPRSTHRPEPIDAIYFNGATEGVNCSNVHQIACHVRWNRWRNSKRLQLVIRDMDRFS